MARAIKAKKKPLGKPQHEGGEGMEITTKKGENGDTKYFLPGGKEIDTYSETPYDIFTLHLCYIRRFVRMAMSENENDDCELENMFDVLLDGMEKEVEEAFEIIWDTHGRTHIDRARYHQVGIDPKTMLGVIFTPAKKAPEEHPSQDTPEA
jgi:hypothetical protein